MYQNNRRKIQNLGHEFYVFQILVMSLLQVFHYGSYLWILEFLKHAKIEKQYYIHLYSYREVSKANISINNLFLPPIFLEFGWDSIIINLRHHRGFLGNSS